MGLSSPLFLLKKIHIQREVVQWLSFLPSKELGYGKNALSYKYVDGWRGKGHYGALLLPTVDSVLKIISSLNTEELLQPSVHTAQSQ